MKNIAVIALIAGISVLSAIPAYADEYATTGIISEITGDDSGLVYVILPHADEGTGEFTDDFTMYSFFYNGGTDLQEFDVLSLMMDDNGTEEIWDDEILEAKYSGILVDHDTYEEIVESAKAFNEQYRNEAAVE